jgi:hypothetical protein
MTTEATNGAKLYKLKGRGNSPKISLLRTRNSPPADEPFVWFTLEMLNSPAWRAMPLCARQVVERVASEHMTHGGNENGKLPITHRDFERYGIRRKSVPYAVAVAVALGWIDVVEQGHRGVAGKRRAAHYALTWVDRWDGSPRTNRWKGIKTDEEAAKLVARIWSERAVAAGWRAAGRAAS